MWSSSQINWYSQESYASAHRRATLQVYVQHYVRFVRFVPLCNCFCPILPYSCNLCPKNFVTRPSLVKHLRVHRQEKPHGCTVCNKRFATTYHLKLHMHTHTGARPYKCDTCDRAFTQLGTLKAHQLKAHPQEDAQCKNLDFYSI